MVLPKKPVLLIDVMFYCSPLLKKRLSDSGFWLCCTAFFGMILVNGWVCDDAYITFRVVDNLVNGYGLRWNIDERVQTFTNPLWLFLHVPFYALTENIYLTTIALSFLCSVGAVLLLLRTALHPLGIGAIILVLLPLLLSDAFFDYTSSGLENPLSFLLFAGFGFVLMRCDLHARQWRNLCLIASFAAINRLDSVLFYLPVLTALWIVLRAEIRIRHVALASVPLLSWLLFSLFYFGFLFPNTKYAKLNTAVDMQSYLTQGFVYITDALYNDTISVVLILAAIATALCLLIGGGKQSASADSTAQRPHANMSLMCIGLGILLYVLYIISVGGDFMRVRFLSIPVFASVWLIYVSLSFFDRAHIRWLMAFIVMLAPFELLNLEVQLAAYVKDQKRMYETHFRFMDFNKDDAWLRVRSHYQDHPYLKEHGGYLQQHNRQTEALIVRGAIGIYGFYAGPNVTIIDNYALSDPLLARLPWRPREKERHYPGLPIGHFPRGKPLGYIQTRLGDTSHELHPELAYYYDKLRFITAGDLWSWGRLKAIAAFNMGAYDHHRKAYIASDYGSTTESPTPKQPFYLKAQGSAF